MANYFNGGQGGERKEALEEVEMHENFLGALWFSLQK